MDTPRVSSPSTLGTDSHNQCGQPSPSPESRPWATEALKQAWPSCRPRAQRWSLFNYDGKLTCKGFERAAFSEISNLIREPTGASPEELAEWTVHQKDTLTRDWMAAQLLLYGVMRNEKFCQSSSKNQMKERFISYMQHIEMSDPEHNEQCIGIPKDRLDPLVSIWDRESKAYVEKRHGAPQRAEFDSLETMEEKLSFDPPLFMDSYFLDRNTTPNPLIFRNINFDEAIDVAKQVEGLNWKVAGTGSEKHLALGWDPRAVMKAVRGEAKNATAKENAVQREVQHLKNVEARLQKHRDYMKHQTSPCKDMTGSYIVECTGNGWRDDMYQSDTHWIDIRESLTTDGVYEATFDLGPALKGVAIIGKDEDTMREHDEIADEVDGELYDEGRMKNPAAEEDPRTAALIGYKASLKKRARDEDHARFTGNMPNPKRRKLDNMDDKEKFKYWAHARGEFPYPDPYDGALDYVAFEQDRHGTVDFCDATLCEFEMFIWREEVVGLPSLRNPFRAYRVSDTPLHQRLDWGRYKDLNDRPFFGL
ncbi:hypothetical protein F5Y18DRAFT_362494 [Xylariaceae sp. FL1019]|nr:hypothetical protein F5Y18DRAFT_362494 [Xylariaceae sp. FL1019]